jgi:general secretion pathway protein D
LLIAHVRLPLKGLIAGTALALVAAACAAGNAFRQGDAAMKSGDLDQAVAYYRKATEADPENPNYKIALQRAMQAASRAHLERAHQFEQQDQLEAALGEYKAASEYDPSNRLAVSKVAELERTIRERIEASRPKPAIQALKERVRQTPTEPVLNPASREPLNMRFPSTQVRDILNFIGQATGINVLYDRDFADRQTSIELHDVTLEQALNQIMSANQLSYKVLNQRSIFVFPDTSPKHQQYDEQVVQTFYVSHADATEVAQTLSVIIRLPGVAVQPQMSANKTNNTITVRGTPAMVEIIRKIIEQNDKPRAEVVLDVEILEVNRNRAKQYGLNLSDYAVGVIFSPEVNPTAAAAAVAALPGSVTPTAPTTTTPRGTAPGAFGQPGAAFVPPFNLNTISRGISTADFYLAVPSAVVRFLEQDSQSKLLAKPQLRGSEGQKLTLNLGSSIPVIQTSYTPLATGGAGVNPLSSYNYKDVGINLDMTPRVTLEGDIILDLGIDDSAVGSDVSVAGVTVPSFVQRKVSTRLRLRDGESNLLAGLLEDQSANSVQGFPGAIHVPVLKQLFSGNNVTSQQTDIVMLLTPHIVRAHEITESDLRPIYIGSQGAAGATLGVGGPPPLIAQPEPPVPQPAPAAPPTATSQTGIPVKAPPGSSPIPGTVPAQPVQPQAPPLPPVMPTQPAAPAAVAPTQPAPETPQPPTPPPPTPAVPAEPPTTSPGVGTAQVVITPPGGQVRAGGGPYTVPISIVGATRLSTVTLTLTYDPAILRVRTVENGSFMAAGGVVVRFAHQESGNRIDITITRSADATGATGTGVLAAVVFDAVAAGNVTLTLSGAATGPGGSAMGLQFRPVTVTVQ